MNDYVEKDDAAFGTQLTDNAAGLATYGPALGFSAGEIADADKDAKLFNYILGRQSVTQAFGQTLTKYKILARKGNGTEVLGAIPEAAANPLPLPEVTAANIEGRFRQRAAKAKASPAYTKGIGETLRIEKVVVPFDPNNGTPTFKIELNFAGHPHITFKKGKWDGVEIWKLVTTDSGPTPSPDDSRFQKVERVFGHDYVDPAQLPPFGKSETWIYKMVYIYQNKQVGSWSVLLPVVVSAGV